MGPIDQDVSAKMSASSLFSVVIPVYNVKPYLAKCLDSVLVQTLSDWECVCVDDGSTDGSAEILDDFAKRDPRIKVIHQDNGGVSVARNVALEVAKGDWVQFLDSDDSIAPDFLERLSDAIEKNPDVDAIEHTAVYCSDDGSRVVGDGGKLPPHVVLSGDDILSDPWGRKYTALARCSCYKIFRRSIIEKNHLRFERGIPVGEDTLFARLFYAHCGKVAVCPEVAGYLRIMRPGSALTAMTAQKLLPQIRSTEILVDEWHRIGGGGLKTTAAAAIVMLFMLGRQFGGQIRQGCIDHLAQSKKFNRKLIPFLVMHGTFKARLFGLSYWMLPKHGKIKMLSRYGAFAGA